jgi:hypothetical protein
MKRDVRVINGKVVVHAKSDDAVAQIRRLNLPQRLAAGGTLTDAERDLALLALLQERGILTKS